VFRQATLDEEGSAMKQYTTAQFDGTVNAGRKGVAYDWQSLLATAEASTLDRELADLAPRFAQQPAR
jgi:hypothetical protein